MRTRTTYINKRYRLHRVDDLQQVWDEYRLGGICHYFLKGSEATIDESIFVGFTSIFLKSCDLCDEITMSYKISGDTAWIMNNAGSRIAYLTPNTEESRRLFVSRFCRNDQYAVSSLVDLFS